MEEQVKYRLEARIGAGGMGEVFRGVASGEHGFERPVAIKRIDPRVAADEEFVGRFIREARIGGALVHPNVITVLDLARAENGDLLLVMELVDGLDLVRLSRRGALPTAAAVYVVRQVLQALRATHAQGVSHLDVTPHNVRITESGLVKLGDFGLATAKEISWQSNHHDIRGKIGYLSPEQAQDDNIDHRADLFQLGVIFYELLTGRRPYGEPRTIDEYVLRVFSITVVPPSAAAPGVPAELDAVVLKMLARDPTHRYQSAQEILDVLPEQDSGMRILAKLVAEHMAALEATTANDELSNAPTVLRPVTVEDAGELDAKVENSAKLGQNGAGSRENSAKLAQNRAGSRENSAKLAQNRAERSKSGENRAEPRKNRAESRKNRAERCKNRAERCENRAEPRENRNNGANPKSNRKFAALAVCVMVGFGAIWSLQTRDTPRVQSAVETANEVSSELAPQRAGESSREVVLERSRKFPSGKFPPTPPHGPVPDSVREHSREKSVLEPADTPASNIRPKLADTTAQELRDTSRSRPKSKPARPGNDGEPEQAQKPQIQAISYGRGAGER
jgi:serine/threonine protein kinase